MVILGSKWRLVSIGLCFFTIVSPTIYAEQPSTNPCYDEEGNPIWCMAPFENLAFGKPVEATSTCGLTGPETYCKIMVAGKCPVCDSSDPNKSHPPSAMTDQSRASRWQSQTLMKGQVNYPNTVNITINLGHQCHITYITLRFFTSRPESLVIYKKTNETSEWTPYQYYSASCQSTFGRPMRTYVQMGGDKLEPFCVDQFSDISPLTGGSVTFSTLVGRTIMGAEIQSHAVQEWLTASEIKIVLTRMNTFGDEVLGEARTLRSYFYAISDLSVGGRCKCNGHGSKCIQETKGGESTLVCKCEHHTTGVNCERCQDFYNKAPWSRALRDNANECKACNCNGHAEKCEFDEAMYRATGDGGRCVGCRDFTTGPHCEKCLAFSFRRTEGGPCQPCNCSSTGSESRECDSNGKCSCVAGVAGDKCDQVAL